MIDIPYFMTDKEWYTFDFEQRRFVLTDKATPKARASYEKYRKEMKRLNRGQ